MPGELACGAEGYGIQNCFLSFQSNVSDLCLLEICGSPEIGGV